MSALGRANLVPWLPDDIFQAIFDTFPPSDGEAVQTLLACTKVDKRIRAIASLPYLWKPRYAFRWRRSDPAKELQRQVVLADDWFALYSARRKLDYEASILLDELLGSDARGRLRCATSIVENLGRDVWDYLYNRTLLEPLQEKSLTSWLAETYWARELIGVMERREAVDRLIRISAGEDMLLEEGLSVLSAFWSVDYDTIRWQLDEIATQCRQQLLGDQLPFPGSQDFDLKIFCQAIVNFMSQKEILPADQHTYNALHNHFIHLVLSTHKHSLPLTLVAIFVSIARRLGLDAHAVSFPGHVHAVVAFPSSDPKNGLALDIFNASTRFVIDPSELLATMNAFRIPVQFRPSLLAPASTDVMLRRAASNISGSIQRQNPDQGAELFWARHTAIYAMLTVTSFIPNGPVDNHAGAYAFHVSNITRYYFPFDLNLVIRPKILPRLAGFQEATATLEHALGGEAQAMNEVVEPKRRRSEAQGFFVGQVVKHRLTRHTGVIIEWDQTQDHLVAYSRPPFSHQLNQGSQQPFYHISRTTVGPAPEIYSTLSLTEYAAEEDLIKLDIDQVGPSDNPLMHPIVATLLSSVRDMGRKFRDVKIDPRVGIWFVPGPDLEREYPDDFAMGAALTEGSSR